MFWQKDRRQETWEHWQVRERIDSVRFLTKDDEVTRAEKNQLVVENWVLLGMIEEGEYKKAERVEEEAAKGAEGIMMG